MQKWHFKPELQKLKKHRSAPKCFMKLFVDGEDNHRSHFIINHCLKKVQMLNSWEMLNIEML